jgi:hypothetical protein
MKNSKINQLFVCPIFCIFERQIEGGGVPKAHLVSKLAFVCLLGIPSIPMKYYCFRGGWHILYFKMKNKHSLKRLASFYFILFYFSSWWCMYYGFLQATHSTHISMKKNCGFGSDIFMLQIRQTRVVLYHQHPQGHEEWVYLNLKKNRNLLSRAMSYNCLEFP